MAVDELMKQTRDAITVKRVYGEPFDKNGTTVITAAKIQGGAGGGEGTAGQQTGSGGGFGVNARPTGAFVIDGNHVSWRPAFDLNRVILGGQVVAIVALLVLRSMVRWRTVRALGQA